MNDLHHRSPTAPLRRGVLGLCLAASTLVPLAVAAPAASAAPATASRLTLTQVTGTRVARGAGPAIVHATVNNAGGTTATGVRVRYQLPTGLSLVPAASPGCTTSGSLVTCLAGSLAPGASAPVDIALREPQATAVLGTRTGYFLPPTSDGLDLAAGELLQSTWYHDAGVEGTDLALCWPIANPTPNMDVAGGTCDGVNDTPALTPDEVDILPAFPGRYSEPLVRSWEFETEIVAPRSGSYHACGTMIDDGGYLAIAPVGATLTPADLKVTVLSYDSATGAPFDLVGGTRYRVVMRVSNRGFDGIDNGADGGTLAGWDAYGIAPAADGCGVDDAAVFGVADTAWVQRTAADVIVVGSSDLSVLGAVESAPAVDGQRHAAIRIANSGPDATSVRLAFALPTGGRVASPIEGCDRTPADAPTSCEVDSLGPTGPASGGLVIALGFSGDAPGLGWSLSAPSTIDSDPANDSGELANA